MACDADEASVSTPKIDCGPGSVCNETAYVMNT